MWGRPEIEGPMLCYMYGIKLHLIEKFHAGVQNLISHQLLVQGQHQWMKMPAAAMTLR